MTRSVNFAFCWCGRFQTVRMKPNLKEKRRCRRISTMILCDLRIGNAPPELARVRDLCETGMKIATGRRLMLGDRLGIRLPGTTGWVMARVAWCTKGFAGLSFIRAIDLPQVAGVGIRRDGSALERPVAECVNSLNLTKVA